jgi:hypothetical protein
MKNDGFASIRKTDSKRAKRQKSKVTRMRAKLRIKFLPVEA